MGSASNFLENKILDHITGKLSYTMPTVYVALLTDTPSDVSTGSTISEPSGTYGYVRFETSDTDWVGASSGATSNSEALTFPLATGYWGIITHFALVDAGTGGNVLVWGEVSPNIEVFTGSIVNFNIGNLDITID